MTAFATDRSTRPAAVHAGGPGRFAARDEAAQVAVVVVSHNSADDLPGLVSSIRAEAVDLVVRVVVVDNGSTDDSVAVARAHDDVVVTTAGNLGYAGGINLAMRLVGDAESIFVANPDLVIEPGCLAALRRAMEETGAGIVVPTIVDADGAGYPSLRREPDLLTALGDAGLGGRLPRRPRALSEIVTDPRSYASRHRIDWATGAALLIDARVAATVGDWDERFFLYSEETDFFRRAREAGFTAWFEPGARVRHAQGGSGSSAELDALLQINRVRYARKHHGPAWSAAFRTVVVLHNLARIRSRSSRLALGMLADERRWARLPHADVGIPTTAAVRSRPAADVVGDAAETAGGTLIIPAHDEEAVLGRTLKALAPLVDDGVEIIVACNGCTDGTARLARGHRGVAVIELEEPSKTAAMNAAGERAGWPRMYIDADVVLDPRAVSDVFTALENDGLMAARPPFRYETEGASAPVRAYYRARSRMPGTASGLWGAGVYAISRAGHDRIGDFPALVADDLWIDAQFADDEKGIVPTSPSVVRTPRTAGALLAVLRRTYRGNRELAGASSPAASAVDALRGVRGPLSAYDAAVYLAFAVAGRMLARRAREGRTAWERDESSRHGGAR